MDFIPLLRSKKNAMIDCKDSTELSEQKRKKMQQNIKILEYSPWVTKGVIALAIIFGVDWKKQVPFTRRQIPLALGAIAVSAVSDYLALQYVWKQHELDITKLTGFKNGIYVRPEVMIRMRNSMKRKMLEDEPQFLVEEDEDVNVGQIK